MVFGVDRAKRLEVVLAIFREKAAQSADPRNN
jgi:hypothetical protein